MITYTIDSSDLKSLAKVMRAAGPDLNRRMRREIRTVAKPVIDEMKDTIEAMPLPVVSGGITPYSGPSGAGGISGRIAAATKLSITQGGVRIRVSTGALGNASNLPGYIDAGTTWRHPVMGNTRAWVSQRAARDGWFTKTGLHHHPQIRRDVLEILTRYATQLAGRL